MDKLVKNVEMRIDKKISYTNQQGNEKPSCLTSKKKNGIFASDNTNNEHIIFLSKDKISFPSFIDTESLFVKLSHCLYWSYEWKEWVIYAEKKDNI